MPVKNDQIRSSGSSPSPATDDIVCEGFLTKKGHKRRNWKKRFFILRDGEISYYAKKGASEPKGVISLNSGPGISVITMDPSPASDFRFMIITPDQIFPIYAECEADRTKWMKAVEKFCERESMNEDEEAIEVLEWTPPDTSRAPTASAEYGSFIM